MLDPTIALAPAAAIVASGLTFLVSRRTKSGKISDTDADKLWEATTDYQNRIDAEMVALRVHTNKLDVDYQTERTARLECERRLTLLEAGSAAALIIDAAKKTAEVILADAALARGVVKDAAAEARQNLKDAK